MGYGACMSDYKVLLDRKNNHILNHNWKQTSGKCDHQQVVVTHTKEMANFPWKLSLVRTRKDPLPAPKSCKILLASLLVKFPWNHLHIKSSKGSRQEWLQTLHCVVVHSLVITYRKSYRYFITMYKNKLHHNISVLVASRVLGLLVTGGLEELGSLWQPKPKPYCKTFRGRYPRDALYSL